MIIIVEGYDCSGKSTLCNYISNEFDIPIYKTFSEKKIDRNYDAKIETKIGLKRKIDADLYIADFLTQMNKEIDFISDRSVLSYLFYNKEDKELYNWWDNKLKNINGKKVLLFCNPDYRTTKMFLEKRKNKTASVVEIERHLKKNKEFLLLIKKYWKKELIVVNMTIT
jgi:thymidylate kinase